MERKRIPKRILESNIIGKRPVGKPRKSWVNSVEIDSREILKMRNWRRESLDKLVWRRHLKEAKARLRAVTQYKKKRKNTKRKKRREKNRKYKYYVCGHYPSSCFVYKNTILFIIENTTFRRLYSVSVFR
jgi:hypothetical protein